jgi:phosphoglycolate phosphatase-like HAD superfamily hydrolase
MIKLKVIILDFDGVVLESNQVKVNGFKRLFLKYPTLYEEMMEFNEKNISISRYKKFEHLANLLNSDSKDLLVETLAENFSELIKEEMNNAPFVKGVISFIKKNRSKYAVHLASVTPEKELLDLLRRRNLLNLFKSVYGCPPWTKELAIKDIMSKEGVMSSEVLLIGDSAGDQNAAKACDINFIGRESGLFFSTPLPLSFSNMDEIELYVSANYE